MKCFGWTDFRAFITENALCPIFSLMGFFVNFNIHGANFQAFATMDAFIFIAMDTQRLLLEAYTSNVRSNFVLFAPLMKK